MAINRSSQTATITHRYDGTVVPGNSAHGVVMGLDIGCSLSNQFLDQWRLNVNSLLFGCICDFHLFFSRNGNVSGILKFIPEFATIRDRASKPLAKKLMEF